MTLKPALDVGQTEWQAEVIALEQSLAKARREIEVLQRTAETDRARDARAEVSITAALARFEALQAERTALAAEVLELRGETAASEIALQKEKAARATEAAVLRDQLAASESARASEQAKVKALQKEKTALLGESAELRSELATSKRKLAAVYASTSWRVTGPLRRVKQSSGWKKTL